MTLVGHSGNLELHCFAIRHPHNLSLDFKGTVRCLHLLGNRLVSGSTDLTIKVWDLSVEEQWSSIGKYALYL